MTLADKEAALKELEKHKHAAATSHFRMHRSERYMHDYADDPAECARHRDDMERHRAERDASLKAHAASGVTDRHIDIAAQEVLDARAAEVV